MKLRPLMPTQTHGASWSKRSVKWGSSTATYRIIALPFSILNPVGSANRVSQSARNGTFNRQPLGNPKHGAELKTEKPPRDAIRLDELAAALARRTILAVNLSEVQINLPHIVPRSSADPFAAPPPVLVFRQRAGERNHDLLEWIPDRPVNTHSCD
jgi:hypothetical protein